MPTALLILTKLDGSYTKEATMTKLEIHRQFASLAPLKTKTLSHLKPPFLPAWLVGESKVTTSLRPSSENLADANEGGSGGVAVLNTVIGNVSPTYVLEDELRLISKHPGLLSFIIKDPKGANEVGLKVKDEGDTVKDGAISPNTKLQVEAGKILTDTTISCSGNESSSKTNDVSLETPLDAALYSRTLEVNDAKRTFLQHRVSAIFSLANATEKGMASPVKA